MSRHGEFNGTEKSSLDKIRLSWLGTDMKKQLEECWGWERWGGGRILGKRKRSGGPRMTFIEQACRDVQSFNVELC